MIYDLPKSVDIAGVSYDIRSDYRDILDICIMFNDPDLTNEEKAYCALVMFYPDRIPAENYDEAFAKCIWFIDCGDSVQRSAPKLMDWEKDFKYIVAPINRVTGGDIRNLEYMHWWTFISAYYEIGDCLFAQIVNIRAKKAKGKPLDKMEQDFYRDNRELVDMPMRISEAEQDLFKEWGV